MSSDSYNYDEANRLSDVNGVLYTWDDNGNLLSDGVNSYTYDVANRLAAVNGQQSAMSYVYNGLGDRLQETIGEQTTTFIMDYNAGLTQALSDGTNTYIYGVDRLAQVGSGGTEYFLGDALGSVRQLTDSNGAITFARAYDPYGAVTTSYGSAQSTYGFTNEYTSQGLVYLRARYYDPYLNQFIQPDTIVPDPYQPMDWNRYLYTRDNPVNYTDPSGFYRCPWNPIYECTWDDILAYYSAPLLKLLGIKQNSYSLNIPGVGQINTTGTPVRIMTEVAVPYGQTMHTIAKVGSGFMGIDPYGTAQMITGTDLMGNEYSPGERIFSAAFLFLNVHGCLELPELIPPRGFKNAQQYREAMEELEAILEKHGIDDATFRFRGTSTTGLSMNPAKPGKWFSPLTSDIDLSIESTKLSDMLYAAGQTPSKNVPGLFLPAKMEAALPQTLLADLARWNKYWTTQLGVKSIEPAVSDPSLVIHFLTDIIYRRGY